MKFKNILVPHAGTPFGDKALRTAVHLAKLSGATINILYVIEPFPSPPKFIFHAAERKSITEKVADVEETIRTDLEDEFRKRVDFCKSRNINANFYVGKGTPWEEITKFSRNNHIDLIIMSKRRKIPGIKGILKLGSVSRKILEIVKIPILII